VNVDNSSVDKGPLKRPKASDMALEVGHLKVDSWSSKKIW